MLFHLQNESVQTDSNHLFLTLLQPSILPERFDMTTDTSAYCSLLGVFSGSVLQFEVGGLSKCPLKHFSLSESGYKTSSNFTNLTNTSFQ